MSSFVTPASTSENFNSRKGASLKEVKSQLQNSCWTFHHFNINNNGWNPAIEGDGAMVSSNSALTSNNAGIFTPLLNVEESFSVSFNYRFSENFEPNAKRWLKLCLADKENHIVQVLAEKSLDGENARQIQKYSHTFTSIKQGDYRFLILYGGSGGNATIAIDKLVTSAPFKHSGGCSIAPTAGKIKIAGKPDRTAEGALFDKEAAANLKAFLVKDSDNGRVDLFPDGTFVFIPDVGFRGKSTSFIYRACDSQGENLCSLPATVLIDFPDTHFTQMKGSYKYNGHVELMWNTSSGAGIEKFEVERSTDGKSWTKSGTVETTKLNNVNGYTYIDKLNKNTALKKDLYYRLKQVESDGGVSTTNPMIVRVYNTNTLTMICIAPNPEKRQINVNIQLQNNSLVSMRIFDEANNTVIHKLTEGKIGVNNIAIEESQDLKPGDYMLEVIVNSKERMMVKLLKE